MSAVGLGLAVGAAALGAVASTAQAQQIGTLTITPAKGNDMSVIRVSTSKACPPPATNVIVKLFGKGFPASGQNAVGNSPTTAYDKNDAGGVVVPLQYTLLDFVKLQAQPTPLKGQYRIVLTCRGNIKAASQGDFVGKLVFSGASTKAGTQKFVAVNPAPAAPGPKPTAPAASNPGASPQASVPQSTVPGTSVPTPTAPQTGPTTPVDAAGSGSSTSSNSGLAIGLAALAAVAAIVGGAFYFRGRGQRSP